MTAPRPVARAADKVRGVCDRFWLFTIAAIALLIVGGIVVAIVVAGSMPDGAGELFAATMTGLLLIVQKVIDAQAQRRMADQLAQSSPPGREAPADAKQAADDVADAAVGRAEEIGGAGAP